MKIVYTQWALYYLAESTNNLADENTQEHSCKYLVVEKNSCMPIIDTISDCVCAYFNYS